MRDTIRRIAVNLVILAIVVLPLWFVLFWLWTGFSDGFGGNDLWGTFSFNYVVLVLPLLFGGLVQQIALFAVDRLIPRAQGRLIALLTQVTIPLVMSLVSVPLSVFVQPPIAVCTIVSLIVNAYLMRLPPSSQAGPAMA
jgi:hypothetical protein